MKTETKPTVCVVGLGYVGLPLFTRLHHADGINVIGIDTNEVLVRHLLEGKDPQGTCGGEWAILAKQRPIEIFDSFAKAPSADMYIVCVPTPTYYGRPLYDFVVEAGAMIGRSMKDGATIVLESTVAPHTTEGLFREAVESTADLLSFDLAYSPERINPSPVAMLYFDTTVKLVACPNKDTRDKVVAVYEKVFSRGVTTIESIAAAEAAKCFENTQRFVNICLLNEMSVACSRTGIPFDEFETALHTKNNKLPFTTGIIGGHCIPEDPLFLRSWMAGVSKGTLGNIISSADMAHRTFVYELAQDIVSHLRTTGGNCLIVGKTYKPNVTDVRRSGYNALLAAIRELDSDGLGAVSGYDCMLDPVPRALPNTTLIVGLVDHTICAPIHELFDMAPSVAFFNVGNFSQKQTAHYRHVTHY